MNEERDLPLSVFKPHVQTYAIVYANTGEYDLMGHGFLSVTTDQIEEQTVHYLEVESVKDSELLLRSRLRLSNNFEKQRGSVIAWTDIQQKRYHDLAISFQGDRQCDILWRLICQKVGKNYLEIAGRQTLKLPNEHNLVYILEKTKSSKDMVEYHLLNNPQFSSSLLSVFEQFRERKDKMGMGLMGRIIKSIFSNIDYRMVQALFKDPIFQLILEVQKFSKEIDYPRMWNQKIKIRSIVPLNQDLITKIHVIHRLSFYRENILDLKEETHLENILVMTQQEFSQDIIHFLTKEKTIEDLVGLTYQLAQEKFLLNKDTAEDDTFNSETQEIKQLQFGEKKLQFMLEALIISKQMESENTKMRFFDRIIKSGFMEMATDFMDKGVFKALDFFNCFSQFAPFKFMEYLKIKYRESPSDNLHTKLSKKYCLGNQQMQQPILQLLKNLSECFKIKQNLDFFMGTFFAQVFGCCKDTKAIMNVLCEMLNLLQNIQTFFTQALKSKVFQKLVLYLRNQRQDKRSEINTSKILKRILIQNADSSWSFKKAFLNQLNEQVIKSGFFDYCMTVLEKNIRFNNIISSSMLENIRIIRDMKRFTCYHHEIQSNFKDSQTLKKYIAKILEAKEEQPEDEDPFSIEKAQQIEREKEEEYLMSQAQEQINIETLNEESQEQLLNLRRMKRQIEQEQLKDEQIENFSALSKKVKPNQKQMPQIQIKLQLPFDDLQGDK